MLLVLRFMGYILVVVLMSDLMLRDARSGAGRFGESSWIEMTQLVVLFLSGSLCLFIRSRKAGYGSAALLLSAFFGASFIRECDYFLDTYVFDGCWQLLVLLLVGCVLWLTWRDRSRFIAEMKTYLHSLACGLFMGGFLITYVFSRLVGRKIFWQALMGDSYLRSIKDAAEECTELLGYVLLLFSVIELLVMARRAPSMVDETGISADSSTSVS